MLREGKSVAELKRKIKSTERELSHLIEIQWKYIKQMLRFGMTAWIFGVSTFFLAIVIGDPGIIWRAPLIPAPLLILAAAAPILITAIAVRKFTYRIKRLERLRHGLLMQYERAILKRVEEMVSSNS